MAQPQDHRATLAAAITTLIVGFSAIATEIAIAQLGAWALAFLRYGLALCFLVPAAFAIRATMSRNDVLGISILGIGQFGLLVFLFNASLEYIPATRAIVLFSTTPLIAAAIQIVRRVERFDPLRLVAMLACMGGVIACLSGGTLATTNHDSWIGDLSALGSAIVGAVCAIGFGPYMRRCGTTAVTVVAMTAAVIALAVATAFEGLPDLAALDRQPALMVFLLGLGSAGAFWLWVWALGRGDSGLVISFLAAAPIVTACLQVVMLKQPLQISVVIGGVLVSAGLLVLGHTKTNVAKASLG